MTPVDQTRFCGSNTDGKGNCFTACIASLLDLPISEVPDFIDYEDMHAEANKWLKERGYSNVKLCFQCQKDLDNVHFPEEGQYCLVSGTSPRKDKDDKKLHHAVIAKTKCWGVEFIHDPHPSREFLAEPESYRWLMFILGVEKSVK